MFSRFRRASTGNTHSKEQHIPAKQSERHSEPLISGFKLNKGTLHAKRAPDSPVFLCNPFQVPPVTPTLNDRGIALEEIPGPPAPKPTGIARHLIPDLPNIFLEAPTLDGNGNPKRRQNSVCIWSSESEGKMVSFLDSNPSTPGADIGAKDWMALAAAYKDISEGQKGVPIFRRPSHEQLASMVMPLRSSYSHASSLEGVNGFPLILSKSPSLESQARTEPEDNSQQTRAQSAPSILSTLPIPPSCHSSNGGASKMLAPTPKPQNLTLLSPPPTADGIPLLKATMPPREDDPKPTPADKKKPQKAAPFKRILRRVQSTSSIASSSRSLAFPTQSTIPSRSPRYGSLGGTKTLSGGRTLSGKQPVEPVDNDGSSETMKQKARRLSSDPEVLWNQRAEPPRPKASKPRRRASVSSIGTASDGFAEGQEAQRRSLDSETLTTSQPADAPQPQTTAKESSTPQPANTPAPVQAKPNVTEAPPQLPQFSFALEHISAPDGVLNRKKTRKFPGSRTKVISPELTQDTSQTATERHLTAGDHLNHKIGNNETKITTRTTSPNDSNQAPSIMTQVGDSIAGNDVPPPVPPKSPCHHFVNIQAHSLSTEPMLMETGTNSSPLSRVPTLRKFRLPVPSVDTSGFALAVLDSVDEVLASVHTPEFLALEPSGYEVLVGKSRLARSRSWCSSTSSAQSKAPGHEALGYRPHSAFNTNGSINSEDLDEDGVTKGMRHLGGITPTLPPLEFDPYGFAGNFQSWLDGTSNVHAGVIVRVGAIKGRRFRGAGAVQH
ncbi:hypothetical protein DL93DRAFT_2074843 [Clavulina sp. PMI_390]|nr:hypothetical protein DL93DRAFT_2074843 [Clavulina sp. PMI_390]